MVVALREWEEWITKRVGVRSRESGVLENIANSVFELAFFYFKNRKIKITVS